MRQHIKYALCNGVSWPCPSVGVPGLRRAHAELGLSAVSAKLPCCLCGVNFASWRSHKGPYRGAACVHRSVGAVSSRVLEQRGTSRMTTYYNTWQPPQGPPVYSGLYYSPVMDSPGPCFQQPFFPPFQHQPPFYGPALAMPFPPTPMPPPYAPRGRGRPRNQGRGRRGASSPELGAVPTRRMACVTQPGRQLQQPGWTAVSCEDGLKWSLRQHNCATCALPFECSRKLAFHVLARNHRPGRLAALCACHLEQHRPPSIHHTFDEPSQRVHDHGQGGAQHQAGAHGSCRPATTGGTPM